MQRRDEHHDARGEPSLHSSGAWTASRRGFVFNLLKGWNTSTIYNLYLPREIKRLGQELEVDYEIQEGYLVGDFTVAFWKRPANAE